MGRHSDYGPEIASLICARIADGQSVREICRDGDMPGMSTVFRWLADHVEFREQYARAKEAQAEHLAEDILDIADNGLNDWIERKGDDGQNLGWKENGEAIQRSRLRVDSRKWLLSKLLPKKYGDRVLNEHSGPDGKPIELKNISNRDRAKAVLATIGKAKTEGQ